MFDFARDYLGLLKAAVIAAGLVPPGMEGSEQSLADLLARLVGPGRGIELVSNVNDIPKGSRLAVSTNLLACLIAVCMRATGQAQRARPASWPSTSGGWWPRGPSWANGWPARAAAGRIPAASGRASS